MEVYPKTSFSIISEDYKKVCQDVLKKSRDRNSALYECSVYNMNESEEKGQNILTVIRVLSSGTSYLAYQIWQTGVESSYRLPWMYWVISVAAVFLVVGITMLYTMRKMRKDNVIDVLKQNG